MRRKTILPVILLLASAVWAWAAAPQAETPSPIHVGVLSENGASASSVQNALEALMTDDSIRAVKISAADIAVDGRYLVVECKGEDRWSNEDSKEKRAIGDLWAERGNGKCLFVMPKDSDWGAMEGKLGRRP